MLQDQRGLEIIDRDTCLELLGTQPIARLGLSMDALPVVLPVNFVVHCGEIVVRTRQGTKLDAALARAVVAVEVDDYDAMSHTGWSVLVRGTSRSLDDPAEIGQARDLWLQPWADEHADRWIAVSMDMISGRRIRPAYELHHANTAAYARRA